MMEMDEMEVEEAVPLRFSALVISI